MTLHSTKLLSLSFVLASISGCALADANGRGATGDDEESTTGQTRAGLEAGGQAGAPSTDPTSQTGTNQTQGDGPPVPAGPELVYWGGPVLESVEVWAVTWSCNVQYAYLLPDFYRTIAEGNFVGWLREYSTPTQRIKRGHFMGILVDEEAPTGDVITDDDIQAELQRLVARRPWIRPNANTLFAVHMPPGTTVDRDGHSSCFNFCGYHRPLQQVKKSNLHYTVIPDHSSCVARCGGSTAVEDALIVASHELIESVTDPDFSLTTSMESPRAWADPVYGEVADICAYQTDTFRGYTVQTGWSNRAQACVTGDH